MRWCYCLLLHFSFFRYLMPYSFTYFFFFGAQVAQCGWSRIRQSMLYMNTIASNIPWWTTLYKLRLWIVVASQLPEIRRIKWLYESLYEICASNKWMYLSVVEDIFVGIPFMFAAGIMLITITIMKRGVLKMICENMILILPAGVTLPPATFFGLHSSVSLDHNGVSSQFKPTYSLYSLGC